VARPQATAAMLVRLSAGTVFVLFGIGKFTSHSSEVDSFTAYGLPSPDAFVYAIGALELLGGALLIVGLLTRIAALALAGDMVGGIMVSGLGRGERIRLARAPARLVGTLFLGYTGPGRPSLDHYLFVGRRQGLAHP